MDNPSEDETQPATQFEAGSDDSAVLYEARTILDERVRTLRGKSFGEFLVDWVGEDPETGKPWGPTWQKKTDCTNELISDWKEKKAADPEIVGRWQKEEEERKRQAKAAAASKRKSGRKSTSRAGSVASAGGSKRKRSEPTGDVLTEVTTSVRRKSGLQTVESGSIAGVGSDSSLSPEKVPTNKRRALGIDRDDPIVTLASNETSNPSPAKSRAPAATTSNQETNSTAKRDQTPEVVIEKRAGGTDDEATSVSDDHSAQAKVSRAKGKQPVRQNQPLASAASRKRGSNRGRVKVYGNSSVRPRQATAPSLMEQIFSGESAIDSDEGRMLSEVPMGEDPADPVEDAEDPGTGVPSESSPSDDSVIVLESGPMQELSDTDAPGRAETPKEINPVNLRQSKRVVFAETQESNDSVVPGTISTVDPSQPSQQRESSRSPDTPVDPPPGREGPATPSPEVSEATQNGSEVAPSAAEVVDAVSQAAHATISDEAVSQPETPGLESSRETGVTDQPEDRENSTMATPPSPRGGMEIQMSEAADVSIDSSLDADLTASQAELFKTAVNMMAQHGYEEEEDASQGQMTVTTTITDAAAEIASPVITLGPDPGSTEDRSPPPPVRQVEGPDPARVARNSRRSTPERSVMRPLAHFNPSILRSATTTTVVHDFTFTQEPIDQFSSPNRSPIPMRKKAQDVNVQTIAQEKDDSDVFGVNGTAAERPTPDTSIGSARPRTALATGLEDAGTAKLPVKTVKTPAPPAAALAQDGSGRPTVQARASPERGLAAEERPLDTSSTAHPDVEIFRNMAQTAVRDLQEMTNLRDVQAIAVGRLERANTDLEQKCSLSYQTIESLKDSLKSAGEDLQLHQDLYSRASDRAVELARENAKLEDKLSLLRGQLDLGLKQQKLHFQAEVERLDDENTQLKHKLAFLLEQNRSTGDAIRHRAAQYPNLQREHYKLAETVRKERGKVADAQSDLRKANKEISRLQRQLDLCDPSDESDVDSGSDEEDLVQYPRPSDLVALGYTLPGPKKTISEGDSTADAPTTQPISSLSRLPEQLEPGPTAVSGESTRSVVGRPTQPQLSLLLCLEQAFARSSLPFDVRIDVVQSQTKKLSNAASLFPYAYDQHKTWESRILVTVTGQAAQVGVGATSIMVSALEAYVFTIPATLSTVVYISKVDSSGYSVLQPGLKAPALTSILMTSFIKYYISPRTRPTPRVYCRLFARAQKQYLFANSSEGGTKKVLTGLGLCKWWKTVFEKAVMEVELEQKDDVIPVPPEELLLNCWLPGIDPVQAKNEIGPSRVPGAERFTWSFGPPFGPFEKTPLYPDQADVEARKLACLVPRFEDDPKGRYLDELVINASSKAQATLRREGTSNTPQNAVEITVKAVQQKRKEDEAKLKHEAALSLDKFKPAEFWETLSARQDCYPGDQTGFLGLGVYPATPLQAQAEDIKALEMRLNGSTGIKTKIVARLVRALLEHDFGSMLYAVTASTRYLSEMQRILSAELGEEAWQRQCVAHIPKNGDAAESPVITVSVQAAESAINVLIPVKKRAKRVPQSSSTSRSGSNSRSRGDGPLGQVYRCKWKLGDGIETQCSALLATSEEFERHVKSHTS